MKEALRGTKGILLAFAAVWGILAAWMIPRVFGPLILPDEYGYWAQAAAFAGLDWREVTSRCSYYSFGYGLFMFPFMKLIEDPVTLYRLFIGLNYFLIIAGIFLLFLVLCRSFGMKEKKLLALISGVTMCYAAYVTYAQTTMTETLLTFLYLLLAVCFFRWQEKPDLKSSLCVFAVTGYMYLVHMRTISILLATAFCMVLLMTAKQEKRRRLKSCVLILLFLCIFLLFATGVKEVLIEGVAAEDYRSRTSGNDYAGQLGKLKELFSLKGILLCIAGVMGKVFYLGCASFGLYFWGIAFLIQKVRAGFRAKKNGLFWLWLLMTHAGALGVTTIYCLNPGRLDGVIYGRYHENTLPVILALGILQVIQTQKTSRRIRVLLIVQSLLFFVIYSFLGSETALYMNRPHITGIFYAAQLADNYVKRMLVYAYGFGCAGGVLLMLTAKLKGRKGRLVPVFCACALWCAASFFPVGYMVLPGAAAQKEDVEALRQVREMARDGGREVCYLYDGSDRGIFLAQFMLKESALHLISEEAVSADVSGIVIAGKSGGALESLGQQYKNRITTAHYAIYY